MDYVADKYRVTNQFVDRAKSFGFVDKKTQTSRKSHLDLGFAVVFAEGVSEEKAIDVLRSPETMRILNSGEW